MPTVTDQWGRTYSTDGLLGSIRPFLHKIVPDPPQNGPDDIARDNAMIPWWALNLMSAQAPAKGLLPSETQPAPSAPAQPVSAPIQGSQIPQSNAIPPVRMSGAIKNLPRPGDPLFEDTPHPPPAPTTAPMPQAQAPAAPIEISSSAGKGLELQQSQSGKPSSTRAKGLLGKVGLGGAAALLVGAKEGGGLLKEVGHMGKEAAGLAMGAGQIANETPKYEDRLKEMPDADLDAEISRLRKQINAGNPRPSPRPSPDANGQ